MLFQPEAYIGFVHWTVLPLVSPALVNRLCLLATYPFIEAFSKISTVPRTPKGLPCAALSKPIPYTGSYFGKSRRSVECDIDFQGSYYRLDTSQRVMKWRISTFNFRTSRSVPDVTLDLDGKIH